MGYVDTPWLESMLERRGDICWRHGGDIIIRDDLFAIPCQVFRRSDVVCHMS